MDLSTYVDRLRDRVTAASAVGGPATAEAGEQLLVALDPAIRLTFLEALSDATADITADLPGGSVEVRLRGRDVEFVVQVPPAPQPDESVLDLSSQAEAGDQARLTLRLPQELKTGAEAAAERAGQSLNSWLVSRIRFAGLSGPAGPDDPQRPRAPYRRAGQHHTGWA